MDADWGDAYACDLRLTAPVINSSVIRWSKKLSNLLSLLRARARMSSFLSGFPDNAISSSTTAANLRQHVSGVQHH